MNNWLEYIVPKKFVALYVRHIFTNFSILILFGLLFFGFIPSAVSFAIVWLAADLSFYFAVMRKHGED